MKFSFWLELVTYLERQSSAMCEKLRINQMSTVCIHWQYFCLFVGTRVQLLECIFGISERLIEFDPIGIE